jgi:hypothetical protein
MLMEKGLQQQLCKKNLFLNIDKNSKPIPVVELYKVWFCSRSLAGIVVSNPTGLMDVCLL